MLYVCFCVLLNKNSVRIISDSERADVAEKNRLKLRRASRACTQANSQLYSLSNQQLHNKDCRYIVAYHDSAHSLIYQYFMREQK